MSVVVSFVEAFMGIFKLGAENFMGMITGIIPVVLILLTFMGAITNLVGKERMNKLGTMCAKNIVLRQGFLPFLSAFMLSTPMCLSPGIYLPEFYKPGYFDSVDFHCHTNNGLFPHINPGELFVFLGIASGVEALGFSTVDLGIRYFLVGLVMNCFCGWVTEKVTDFLCRNGNVVLSKKPGMSNEEYRVYLAQSKG